MENILTNTINNDAVTSEEFLKDAVASTAKSKSRMIGKVGVMSIAKSKTCNRLTLSKELLEELDRPETIQIAFKKNSIIIGGKLPDNHSLFSTKTGVNRCIIYSTELVREIADLFNLDFNRKTSITFQDVDYITIDECPVAVVKIK